MQKNQMKIIVEWIEFGNNILEERLTFFHAAKWMGLLGAGKCTRKPHRWSPHSQQLASRLEGQACGWQGDSWSVQWRKFMEGRLEPCYVGICMLGEGIGFLFCRVNSSYVCLCLCLGLACFRVNLEKVKSDSLYFFLNYSFLKHQEYLYQFLKHFKLLLYPCRVSSFWLFL